VGDDDTYLSEPTYNNLDPVWAQRHGFGPGTFVLPTSRDEFSAAKGVEGNDFLVVLSSHDGFCCHEEPYSASVEVKNIS
jgi:hypothetical protein